MTTIKLNINDELLNQTTPELIKDYLEEQLELLRLKSLSENIKNAISESNMDIEKELKQAKQKAWEEYKKKYLAGIVK